MNIDINILAAIEGVQKAEEEDGFRFKLQTLHPEDVKKHLLRLSLQNNLNVLSLQSESKSLEEVFRNLTGNIQNN